MKIRIKSNSIRYRLTRTDVKQLAETGFLEETLDFCGQSLAFTIQVTHDAELAARFENNTVTLLMPQQMVNDIEDTETVGFDGSDGQLHLLVEKDFTCLENVSEDQGDHYPNPLAEKYNEQGI